MSFLVFSPLLIFASNSESRPLKVYGVGDANGDLSLHLVPSFASEPRTCMCAVPGELDPLSFHKLYIHMHVHKKKFERNSSLEYYHMTCIGKTIKTYKLKRTTGQN
ncbi:unnamed protein product [Porites lobata]|uniref:Uncharacterized protein n=1 Tax=Porites lobata TaxID=104759 RepID=A0ABN8S9Q3_9CNID|nr:unnamed protein product [Porites lobata]